jgi:ABC-type glycerol-3-phosphate transport system substrate-binding protein
MNRPFPRLLAVLALAAPALLASCGLLSEPSVKLLTDRAELAAYVERYNARQDSVRVELEYSEVPYQSVLDGRPADAVVGEWLSTPQLLDRFDSTADILKPGRIDPSWFYPGLLSMGSKDGRPVLIPISFDLPAVVFSRPDVKTELPALFMPLELMKSMSASFNTAGKTGIASMGFSPLWNQDFLTCASALFGARFRAGRGGLPAFDPEGVAKTLEYVRGWVTEVNGGFDQDSAFAQRNLVQPWYKLVSNRKVLFSLVPFSEFLAVPEDKRRDLDFRWLSSGSLIPALDDVLFAGVLRSGRNRKGAKAFLEWFFSQQNQRSFLDVSQARRIGVFAVTNGFSALKSVNERDLPQKYPVTLGHVPPENMLVFPETLADNWLKVRDEVIRGWFVDAISGKDTGTLEKRIDEWQKAMRKK